MILGEKNQSEVDTQIPNLLLDYAETTFFQAHIPPLQMREYAGHVQIEKIK